MYEVARVHGHVAMEFIRTPLVTARRPGPRGRQAVFWTVMTAVSSVVVVVYGVIGRFGVRWGMSPGRARKFTNSSWLAIGWTAVCYGHLALSR